MDGFSRVNSGEIKITLRMGSVNTGVIQSEYNDNNGFFYSVPIDELSRYEVTDKNGEVIEKGEHSVKSIQNTTSYKDYKSAKANLRDDVAKLKNTTAQKSFYEIKNKIIVAIYPYDFYNQTTARKVYSIKKHASEKLFESHMQIAVESFSKWSFKKNGDKILEELEESIKFWQVQNDKIKSSNNSKDLEIFKATSMNLALVFYYGDKIDESLTCLKNLLEKMPNFKAAKEMQSDILETKARMELNAIYTTHFDHKG